MPNKSIWISFFAVVVSFIGGFLLANTLNRGEIEANRAENDGLKTAQVKATQNSPELTLTSEEIETKIAQADANQNNFAFQKNLGLALYRYGSMKQDPELISESARILQRAFDLDPADFDIQTGLGNAYFDVGYFNKDNESFVKSREYYGKALAKRPGDVEIRTDQGITYFLQQPPDLERAVGEFEKSLAINPKHEKTLQFLIQSLVKQNETGKAAYYLEQLKKANADNPSITELSMLLDGGRVGLKK